MDHERGRKLLQDLAKQVAEKVSPTGEQLVNREGLKMVELLARELTGATFPGLKLHRDAPSKFRLQRSPRNAEICVHWQRDINALVMTGEKFGEPKAMIRFVYDQYEERWRRFEGEGTPYEDLAAWLVEFLYPEGKPST